METEIGNLKLKLEIKLEYWIKWKLTLEIKIEYWNQKLKLKTD